LKSLVTIAYANKKEHYISAMSTAGIQELTVKNVVDSVAASEDIVIQTFDLFKNVQCIEKYMTNNENYVAPVTVNLGEGQFQHISVIETLKRIKADPSFKNVRKLPKERSDAEDDNLEFCLKDVDDGRRIREIPFFKSNPDALRYRYYLGVVIHIL
jgi:hypothetical protein